MFAASLTGKVPGIVIYDTNHRAGRFEHRIGTAARRLGIEFRNPRLAPVPPADHTGR